MPKAKVANTRGELLGIAPKRTNVRLPNALHAALKKAAVDRGSTIEQVVLAAVERELGIKVSPSGSMSAADRSSLRQTADTFKTLASRIDQLLVQPRYSAEDALKDVAYRFVQYLPSVVVIKHPSGRIEWCNRAFEFLFAERLDVLRGRTTEEILNSTPRQDVLAHIQAVLETGRSSAVEPFEIRGKTVSFLTHRFLFSDRRGAWIGDISFPLDQCVKAVGEETRHAVFANPEFSSGKDDVTGLLWQFLEHLPTAAALKERDGCIEWCNAEYAALVQTESRAPASSNRMTNILGKRAEELFNLPPTHPTVVRDHHVASSGTAIMASEMLPGHITRTSVRFPIYNGVGSVEHVGVVSLDLGDNVQSQVL